MFDITIIGFGNIGWNLAYSLNNTINKANLTIFCRKNTILDGGDDDEINGIKYDYSNNFDFRDSKSNIFIVAVSDNSIASVLSKTSIPKEALIIHTSGTTGLDVFQDKFKNFGVLWPLQSFTKGNPVGFSKTPLILEANNASANDNIAAFAKLLSSEIHFIPSAKRKHLHLAAVFANNFSNFMYSTAKDLLENENVDFNILKPLITSAVEKAFENSPETIQTGPARRNDTATIKKHLALLKEKDDVKKLYELISELIIKKYH